MMFTEKEALAVSVALAFAGSKGLIGGLDGAASALGLATIPRRHRVTLRLKTDLATAHSELFDTVGLFKPSGAEVILFSQVDDLDWYARLLTRLSFDFVLVEPVALQKAMREVAERLLRLA